MNPDQSQTNVAQSRLKLLFVIFLFLGPLFAAFIWYYGFGAILAPKGESNNAPLITPAVALERFSNPQFEGDEIGNDELNKFWTIVHLLPTSCTEDCKLALYNTRQTRIAVGKDSHRIARILVTDNAEFAEQLKLNHADAKVVYTSDNGLEKQLLALKIINSAGQNDAVLIDPLGNAMMILPLDLDPKLLLKDLKKLLKLSRIG